MDACSSHSSVLVALQLLLQGQQLGKGRIRVGLFVAAGRLVGAPGPRRPVVVAAIAITPRPTLRPFATFGAVAAGLAIPAVLTILSIMPLLAVRLLFGLAVGSGLGRLTFDHLTSVITAMTPTPATWFAFAVGRRSGIGSSTTGVGRGRRFARSLTFGGNNRTLGTAATAALFAAGTAFARRTAGPPYLDGLRRGRSCGLR